MKRESDTTSTGVHLHCSRLVCVGKHLTINIKPDGGYTVDTCILNIRRIEDGIVPEAKGIRESYSVNYRKNAESRISIFDAVNESQSCECQIDNERLTSPSLCLKGGP